MSQEFRLKNIDETRNYFLEEIKENELISRKYNKVCTSYIEILLIRIILNTFLVEFLQLVDVLQYLFLLFQ